MDLALAVLLLWGLLFVPLGIVLHWMVLGDGARVRALPITPITGIAAALLVLATLGRVGVDAGESWVGVAFVVAAVASIVFIWRREIPWRSRELIGAALMLLFAVALVQLPVVGTAGEGPLGYGTAANPVEEVAAIESSAHGPAAELGISKRTRDTRDERPIGFEQFAALTVALGLEDDEEGAEAGEVRDPGWTAYGLHAAITGMLAALVALPLFGFARARGVKWLGLVVLVPLGVLAPAVFLALANGEGAALASVPFTTCAVFSLLVTRRDRGWWALAVLYGAAIAATAGPVALLPLVSIGVAWMFLRSDTYEHLSQHDSPVASLRVFGVTAAAAVLGIISVLPLLGGDAELLAWQPLHTSVRDALQSWPFAWLASDLSVRGPVSLLEHAVWLIGPALLAIAAIYAVVRNERRELGVLVGAVAAAVIAAASSLGAERAGIRLFEFTILSVSPFLAALAVRGVALAREYSREKDGTRRGRFAGTGPSVLVVLFVVLSFAATAATGTRMVHAPVTKQLASTTIAADGTPEAEAGTGFGDALIAAGDPWLAFVIDGERVRDGFADADAISEERNGRSKRGARTTGYDSLVLSSSPLASDPSLDYVEQPGLDTYQVRLFRNQRTVGGVVADEDVVDPGRGFQRRETATADRAAGTVDENGIPTDTAADAGDASATDGAGDATSADSAADEADCAGTTKVCDDPTATLLPRARVHRPVEQAGDGPVPNTPPDRPAGLLLPNTDVKGCTVEPAGSSAAARITSDTCEPDDPEVGERCTDADVDAARSPLDRDRAKRRTGPTSPPEVLVIDSDPNLPRRPALVGVQCFDVPLDVDSSVLVLHTRDIGNILGAETASESGPEDAWTTKRDPGMGGAVGGLTRSTSTQDATLTFGDTRLITATDGFDVVLEGAFGAGLEVSSSAPSVLDDGSVADTIPVGTFRGSATGFSEILRRVPLGGGVVTVRNSTGTDVTVGRLFARSRDFPRSCDVGIALAEDEQREIRLEPNEPIEADRAIRPGLTVTVVEISGTPAERVARVAVGSYMTRRGLPRYTLLDWTEQHDAEIRYEGCDGTEHVESGSEPAARDTFIDPAETAGTMAELADDIRAGAARPGDAKPFDPASAAESSPG
ncbi:MAG: hypothetical protein JWM86_769 [Thermoleophilia bacterium]|nr:hypothetical protein [Thermoleophilia bacterium]